MCFGPKKVKNNSPEFGSVVADVLGVSRKEA
jgi:hypothetical protein